MFSYFKVYIVIFDKYGRIETINEEGKNILSKINQ